MIRARAIAKCLTVRLCLGCGVLAGCSGEPRPPPPHNVPTPEPISPAVAGQLSANLATAASGLAAQTPQAAIATGAAAVALQAGVEANTVSLAAALLAGLPDQAALTTGSAQAYGFQIQVLHLSGSATPQTFSGVVVFQGASDWIVVAGPSPGASFPSSVGVLSSGAQTWVAVTGQESAQLLSEGSACTPPSPLPPEVTSCKQATFTQAGFSITSSAPHSGGATGSRTASLATQDLGGGVSLIVDCNLGSLCVGALGEHVSVAVVPAMVTTGVGTTITFSAQVSGTNNGGVTWTVEETGGGTVNVNGFYTAPANTGVFHVRATSKEDTTKFGRAEITVVQGGVTVSPDPATVATLGTVSFSAEVAGSASQAVIWSIDENQGGGFAAGSITQQGVYTAPARPGTYTVRAKSQEIPTAQGITTVTVTIGCMEALPSIQPASGNTILLSSEAPVRVDSQGRPVVAWVENGGSSPATVAYVARYENGAWTKLGNSGFALSGTPHVLLAIDVQDNPVLDYGDGDSSTRPIHVARWNDASGWSDIATFTSNLVDPTNPYAFALTPAGQPILAFSQFLPSAQLNLAVELWSGAAWSESSHLAITATENTYDPALAVDAAGNITVAFDEANSSAVPVPEARKLGGPGAGAFPSPSPDGESGRPLPRLAFDSTGKLVMAWSRYDPQTFSGIGLEVAAYNGTSWTQVGTTLPGSAGVVVPEMNDGSLAHPLLLNPVTGQLGVMTVSTVTAVYEQAAGGLWSIVCAPIQDPATGGPAAMTQALGMDYDLAGHRYVLAGTAGFVGNPLLVVRVKH